MKGKRNSFKPKSYQMNLRAQTEQQLLAEELIEYIKERRIFGYPHLNDKRISGALINAQEIWDDKPRKGSR